MEVAREESPSSCSSTIAQRVSRSYKRVDTKSWRGCVRKQTVLMFLHYDSALFKDLTRRIGIESWRGCVSWLCFYLLPQWLSNISGSYLESWPSELQGYMRRQTVFIFLLYNSALHCIKILPLEITVSLYLSGLMTQQYSRSYPER